MAFTVANEPSDVIGVFESETAALDAAASADNYVAVEQYPLRLGENR